MEITKRIYVTDRKDWRSWLSKNHRKQKEIWLVYYKKSSGKRRIPYNDAVEEALCFGWIDSTMKKIDAERFAQRFTPRRPTSPVSEMNKERIRRLIKSKKMTSFGLKAVSISFDEKKDEKERLIIAPDILRALKDNKAAWKHFNAFPEGYKRVRIGFIESRRRHGTGLFRKSLQNFVDMTSKNRRFGMVR